MTRTLCLTIISVLMIVFEAHPDVPRLINYQGLLTGADEQPVAEGVYKLTFKLYEEDGTELWSEVHENVYIVNGLFHVMLGDIAPLDMAFDRPYFIGIRIGNDTELEPRMFLSTVPYSIRSDIANSIQGYTVSSEGTPNTLLPLDESGKFPASVLPSSTDNGSYLRKGSPDTTIVSSDDDVLRIHNTGNGRGMTVLSNGSHGIYGKSFSDMAGVEGENAGTGAGLRGSSQNHHGVIGYTEISDKAGVYGNNPNGSGIWGNGETGKGVYGSSTSGKGVMGESTTGNGVEGRSNSDDGVKGWSGNNAKSGVFGFSQTGTGVTGRSEGADGVVGVTTSSNAGSAGVHARNEGTGPAIFSEGNLYVTGDFSGNIGPSNGAPFPKPAFDSGWVSTGEGAIFTLGVSQYLPASEYSNQNFVIDMQTKYTSGYISNAGVTPWDPGLMGDPGRGSDYKILSNNDIEVTVHYNEQYVDWVRIRVWYYK